MWTVFLSLYWVCYKYCFCFSFWFFGLEACGILSPWPRIQPAPSALEGEVLHHWTTREVPQSWIQNLWILLQEWRSPSRWRMVTSNTIQNLKNTTLLPPHQPIRKKSLHTREDNEDSDLFPRWLTVINFSFLPLEFSWSSRIFGAGSRIWVCLLPRLLVSGIKQTPN